MKILVIGGTYFLGREFARLAGEENEIYFINRGSRLPELSEKEREHTFVMDRHDVEALSRIRLGEIDVVVDFCAYQAGDIRTVCDNLGSSIKQYIFISTTDVYRRGTGADMIGEDAEFEIRDFGGEAGAYILGKAALEKEVRALLNVNEKDGLAVSRDDAINFTILRPAFIYGPENYAPREGIYFNWITKAGRFISPADADGYFQMAYVTDVAKAILLCCGNEAAYNKAFNVCSGEKLTYELFEEALIKVSKDVFGIDAEKASISVAEVEERGIPLPFPLRAAESEYYDGSRVRELGTSFISLEEGLRETAAWFKKMNTNE